MGCKPIGVSLRRFESYPVHWVFARCCRALFYVEFRELTIWERRNAGLCDILRHRILRCEGRRENAAVGGPKLRHSDPMDPARHGASTGRCSPFQGILSRGSSGSVRSASGGFVSLRCNRRFDSRSRGARGAVINGGGATDFCARFLDGQDKPLKGFTVGVGAVKQP
jgi:hypothetical protein